MGGTDRPSPHFFQESIPFAVIGSNTVVEARGRRVRGRLYPWGIVEGKALSLRPGSLLALSGSPHASG